jgi:hypothetical protein
MKTSTILLATFAMLALPSCKPSETKDTAEIKAANPLLEAFFVSAPPADAQSIHLARTTAKPGDKITLKGEVMGRDKVFVDGRAAFILGDPEKLTSCDKNPGDTCETPWDACCDSLELKRVGTASIQLIGKDGRVITADLKGTKGLKELSVVNISGIVDEHSTEENFIINATEIHVKKD